MENKPKSTRCVECNKRVKEWKTVIINHIEKKYCLNCLEEQIFTCYECDSETHVSNEVNTNSGDRICNVCYENDYFRCDRCDNTFHNDVSSSVDDGNILVCENCISHYTYCEDCNNYVSRDNDAYCENCDYSLCNGCYENGAHDHASENEEEEEEREVAVVFHNGKRPSKIRINRFVGLEFEAIGGDKYDLDNNLPSGCGLTTDGSLGEEGWEVQTPPSSLNSLEKFIKNTTRAMKRTGFKIDSSCGLHAHIDARDFKNKPRVLSKVLKTLYAIEDIIFSIQPASRWNNTYCQRLTRNYAYNDFKVANLDKLEERWYKTTDKEYRDRVKGVKYHDSRYNGLNLHSLFYRGTLEFRHHSGTLNPVKVLNWVNLILTIVNYALKSYKEKEVVRLLNTPFTPKKLDLFFETFGITKPLQTYLLARVAKFNPNYNFYPNNQVEGD